MDDIAHQAVTQALSGNWQEAFELNQLILKESPDDVGALVRSAKALIELGEVEKAKKLLAKVVKIDPYNTIANKTLLRIDSYGAKKDGDTVRTQVNSSMFLDEPGKTKMTELTHLGDPNVIIQIDPGEEVKLVSSGHNVSVNTMTDKHLGKVPDELGFRLKSLISQGFEFQVLVSSATPECVRVFIREVSRPNDASGLVVFPIEKETEEGEDSESSISD